MGKKITPKKLLTISLRKETFRVLPMRPIGTSLGLIETILFKSV
jgi:hypothetical protein